MPNDVPAPGRLQRIVGVVRDSNARELLMHALATCVHRRLVLFERTTDELPPDQGLRLPLVLGRVMDLSELQRLRPDVSDSALERHRGSGGHLLGAWLDGRLIGVRWIAFDHAWIPYLDRTLALGPGDAYVADSYTHPEHRRRQVNRALSRYAQLYARDSGRSTCIGSVLPENRVAIAAILRYGYRATGRVGWTGVGPLRRYFAERQGAPLAWAPRGAAENRS